MEDTRRSIMNKEHYMQEIEAKLEALDARLNTWKAKAKELEAQGKVEAQHKVTD
jgi:hypothetical protein